MDPHYRDEKERKQLIDRIYAIADSDEGIPKVCPCGGRIVVEESHTESPLGRKYFTCDVFQNNDLHRRKNWDDGVVEELAMLRKENDEQKIRIRRMTHEFEAMRRELKSIGEALGKLDGLDKTID